MKRFLVLLLSLLAIFLLPSCGDNVQKESPSSDEPLDINTLPAESLISGFAFETGDELNGTLEALVFCEDHTLYYFGKTNKTGSWSVSGEQVTLTYTSEDGQAISQTETHTISVVSEVGVRLDDTDYMMVNIAQQYLNRDSTTDV